MLRIKTTNIETMKSNNCVQYCGLDKNKCVYTNPCQIFENCYEKENERLTRTEALTVNELSNYCKSDIKVISGFNDKILCKRFDKDKHIEIGEREVLQIWSELEIHNSIWGNYAESIICVCVHGGKEAKLDYEKKNKIKEEE